MSNPCATCVNQCCHEYVVPLSGFDVYRIATGLHMAPEQFVVAVRQAEETHFSFQLAGMPDDHFELALDKAGERNSDDRPCVFWLPVGSASGRCGIYPYRPFACQVYPATLEGGRMVRREDVICPADAWRDDTFEAPVWRRQYLHMECEADVYRLAVVRWNHHLEQSPAAADGLGLPTYLAYLMALYERVRPLLALPRAEWDALAPVWAEYLAAGESPLLGDVPPQLMRWNDFFWSIYHTASAAFDDGFGT